MFKRIGRDLGCLRGSTPHWLNWDKTHSLTPEILATVEHLHSGGLAATLSVPLVRQHGQRVKLDSFLMQLLGLVRRGLAVDRAVLDLAVVHLARLFGKSPPNIIGVSDEMFAQFLQLPAELALLRRHHGDRRRNIRLRRFRRRLRCRRLRRCRSLGHRHGHGRIAAPFRSRHPRRHDCLLDLSRIADRTADEPAFDLTVVGRRVRKPALECVPPVARQRVADHSEPRIAWRGCAIGPIISNRRPSWSKRIFARAAVTSARSKNLSTVMQLLALKPARLSAFSGLPATRDAKANACQHLSRDRRRIAATRLIVCDGRVKKEGPSNRPSPLRGSTGSASINNPCHPCRHRAWQASVSPSWVSRRPSPLS